jgi:hypothetical protein
MANESERVREAAVTFFNVIDKLYKEAIAPSTAARVASVDRIEEEVDAVVGFSLALSAFAALSWERMADGQREWVKRNLPAFLEMVRNASEAPPSDG